MSSIVIRKAIPGDRSAMLQITRTIWDGHDYLPFVWEEWMDDPRGLFMVAEVDDAVVGLQHLAVLPDCSAWLEGIRVAEDMRGRGIAGALLEYAIGWASSARLNAVRLATSNSNTASSRLASTGGLQEIDQFSIYSAPPLDVPGTESARVASVAEFDEVWEFLSSRFLTVPAEFYTEGWTAHLLTERRLRLLLAMGCVLVAGSERVEALAIATNRVGNPRLRLGYIAGSEDGKRALAQELRVRAHAASVPTIRGLVGGEHEAALLAEGYEADPEHRMVLWGMSLTPADAAN